MSTEKRKRTSSSSAGGFLNKIKQGLLHFGRWLKKVFFKAAARVKNLFAQFPHTDRQWRSYENQLKRMPISERKATVVNQERKIVYRIVTMITIVVVGLGLISAVGGYAYWKSSTRPMDASDKKTRLIEIPMGSSNKEVGRILQEKDIIKNGQIFDYYVKMNNYGDFQAGFYKFAPSMTLDTIATDLADGNTVKQAVTIPEGLQITEIADLIDKDTSFSKKDFLALMEDQDFFKQLVKKYPTLLTDSSKSADVRYHLEGYLFPATYNVTPGSKLKDLVTQMVAKTDTIMENYYDEMSEKNLNVHEVLTLASLVEKEGVKEADRKNIAQVFFNRISVGMPLQSDISILYAKKEHKVKLSVEDTKVDSPYNLYTHTGYGPGPFDSPGESSIAAVMDPTQNSYYYFVADVKTGEVYFASTLSEHNALVEKYVNNDSSESSDSADESEVDGE